MYTVSNKNVAHAGNVVSGSIRFMQIFAEFPGEWGQLRVWSLKMAILASIVHCLPKATRQLLRDATVDDLGHISRLLYCFASNFSKTMRGSANVTI